MSYRLTESHISISSSATVNTLALALVLPIDLKNSDVILLQEESFMGVIIRQ